MADQFNQDELCAWPVKHKGQTYYVGEEMVFDANKKEIGYTCTRGNLTCVVAVDADGEKYAQMDVQTNGTILETDNDVIEAILFLKNGTFGTF